VTTTWWIDGTLVADAQATVRADDHGLVVGDGVFETMKVTDGRAWALDRHLARLRGSAGGLGLDIGYDDDSLRAAVSEALVASGLRQARVRLTVTGGPGSLGSWRVEGGRASVLVAVTPLGERAPSATVAIVPWTRNEHGATAGLKTTSYADNVVALAFARERDADEAIFANTAGMLCEGTGSNVFVVLADGTCATPPLSAGCLAGVTRALVLEAGAAVERNVTMAEFTGAGEAFLTSTTRDVQPIAAIDGRVLPVLGGSATAAAARAFAARVADER